MLEVIGIIAISAFPGRWSVPSGGYLQMDPIRAAIQHLARWSATSPVDYWRIRMRENNLDLLSEVPLARPE